MARNPNKKRCKAKNRKGEQCKNWAKQGYDVCHYHGAGGGAPKNNKNAVTTGERESIVFDFLEYDEKELLNQIELDKLKQIDNEIKLVDIRLRRMMKRIQKLNEDDMSVSSHKAGEERDAHTDVVESVDSLSKIQNIEDAITRVQGQKLRLIESKHKLEMDLGINTEHKQIQIEKLKSDILKNQDEVEEFEDDGFIDALKDEVGEVWDD